MKNILKMIQRFTGIVMLSFFFAFDFECATLFFLGCKKSERSFS